MKTKFEYIEIPESLYPVVGAPDPGTRIYRKEGSQEAAGDWFSAVEEITGGTVSPGGAYLICPVSRAAVHKRIKEGRLSLFLYHITHRKTGLFGKIKYKRESPYGLIADSELRCWRKELEERAIRLGEVTEEELEGAKPDWDGDFMEWKSKYRQQKFSENGDKL